jgi:hypothetical protein
MAKLKQKDILVKYLASHKGEWIESFRVQKLQTEWGYLGCETTKRDREIFGGLTESDIIETEYELNGTKYQLQKKKVGKYVAYRCISGARFEQKTQFIEQPNGTVLAKISTQLVTV